MAHLGKGWRPRIHIAERLTESISRRTHSRPGRCPAACSEAGTACGPATTPTGGAAAEQAGRDSFHCFPRTVVHRKHQTALIAHAQHVDHRMQGKRDAVSWQERRHGWILRGPRR